MIALLVDAFPTMPPHVVCASNVPLTTAQLFTVPPAA
jgi:hypothetical protein